MKLSKVDFSSLPYTKGGYTYSRNRQGFIAPTPNHSYFIRGGWDTLMWMHYSIREFNNLKKFALRILFTDFSFSVEGASSEVVSAPDFHSALKVLFPGLSRVISKGYGNYEVTEHGKGYRPMWVSAGSSSSHPINLAFELI
jgi:hypothetical protein